MVGWSTGTRMVAVDVAITHRVRDVVILIWVMPRPMARSAMSLHTQHDPKNEALPQLRSLQRCLQDRTQDDVLRLLAFDPTAAASAIPVGPSARRCRTRCPPPDQR
jgi:hypothetical protein